MILCRVYRDHQNSQVVLVEKLVSGKLQKPQFIDQEGIIVKKKTEAMERIMAMSSGLRAF